MTDFQIRQATIQTFKHYRAQFDSPKLEKLYIDFALGYITTETAQKKLITLTRTLAMQSK